MPLKIHYPKNNIQHKQKLLVVHGKCDNSAKITVELINKTTGQTVAGQRLAVNHAQSWAYSYQNLTAGNYSVTISQTNSPVITDTASFNVAPPPSHVLMAHSRPPTAEGREIIIVLVNYKMF